MSELHFTGDGWDDYLYWQMQDKKTLRRINGKDRLVYKYADGTLTVYQCRTHYNES